MKNLKIIPRFNEVFPPLSAEEIATLTTLLRQDGCMSPIVVWKGKDVIVDGHNRYVICTEENIPFKIQEKEFENENAAELWIRQFGSGRRSLSSYVKIENAKRMMDLIKRTKTEEEYSALIAELTPHDSIHSTDRALATQAKVGHGMVFRYDYVNKYGNLSEKEKDDLRSGKQTLDKVYKRVKSERYHAEQEAKKNTKAIDLPSHELLKGVYNVDLADITTKQVADNSLDVILTDPPYPREFLDCWRKLAEFAAKKLKKGGILIAMSGQSYLPDVYKNMTVEGLDYYWTACIHTPGRCVQLREKRLNPHWKPLLIYCKGRYGTMEEERTFLKTDVFVSTYADTSAGQEFHEWGQSLPVFEELVKTFTYTSDVVCDPFLGGGTCAVACLSNKRKFVGIELDVDTYNIARNRIAPLIGAEVVEDEKKKKKKKKK